MTNNLNPQTYLKIYCFCFLSVGFLTGSIGPVIPYFAEQNNVNETEYSFIFMLRTVGSILGYLLFKYIQGRK